MAENDQESKGRGAGQEPGATPKEGDRQSLLLQLAERTVLQAETLAQEITTNARQESNAEGAKILAQYTEQAKAEAQQAIEVAQRRSENLVTEATAKALADSEKTLSKARSDSEKLLNKAHSDSEKLLNAARSESEEVLGKARSESEETLGKAQTEGKESLGNAQTKVQEVLGRARREALSIINVSQARADSTESDARLKAEFIIRQTTQAVADGIRSAVLEICNNLLPDLGELGKEAPKAPVAGSVEPAAAIDTEVLENAASNESERDSSPAGTDTSSQSAERPSGRRTRSSDRTRGRP